MSQPSVWFNANKWTNVFTHLKRPIAKEQSRNSFVTSPQTEPKRFLIKPFALRSEILPRVDDRWRRLLRSQKMMNRQDLRWWAIWFERKPIRWATALWSPSKILQTWSWRAVGNLSDACVSFLGRIYYLEIIFWHDVERKGGCANYSLDPGPELTDAQPLFANSTVKGNFNAYVQ